MEKIFSLVPRGVIYWLMNIIDVDIYTCSITKSVHNFMHNLIIIRLIAGKIHQGKNFKLISFIMEIKYFCHVLWHNSECHTLPTDYSRHWLLVTTA